MRPALHRSLRVALALGAMLAWGGGAEADPRRWVPVADKSEVTFVASFPLGNFTGRTRDVSGEFRADSADLRTGVSGVLRISTRGLRTGVDGRDRDMYRVLAADRFPEIRFTVERAEASFPSVTDRADILLTFTGTMAIRGVERPMVFPGRARFRDERLWVRGEGELRMTDFGLRPPARLMLEVGDTVVVTFDVTLAPE